MKLIVARTGGAAALVRHGDLSLSSQKSKGLATTSAFRLAKKLGLG
jgi:hypothetical protein